MFLLELSRVVHQLDNEQNYHIFNLLRTSAASDGLQERRTLDSVRYALASIGLDSAGTQAVFDVRGARAWDRGKDSEHAVLQWWEVSERETERGETEKETEITAVKSS